MLGKTKFNDWTEMYDVEDEYIMEFDSISNGYNTRRNKKKYPHITYSDESRR